MGLKQILEANPQLTIDALQQFQREYDRRFVSDDFTGFDKVRHTYAHMGAVIDRLADFGKTIGGLAKYVQMIEDGETPSSDDIENKVIPDLLVYSGWLADVFGVNMENAYLGRILDNINRLHKDKISTQELQELRTILKKRTQGP